MQASDKQAKLGDLMLAKALEGAQARDLTRPGELLGDVNYMSPERTHGTAGADGRSQQLEAVMSHPRRVIHVVLGGLVSDHGSRGAG